MFVCSASVFYTMKFNELIFRAVWSSANNAGPVYLVVEGDIHKGRASDTRAEAELTR